MEILKRAPLALLAATLLSLAFPPANEGWLAWLALMPLLAAIRALPAGAAAALGFLFGAAHAITTLYWTFELPAFGVVHAFLGAAYLALYPAAWCAGVAWFTRSPVPLVLTGPSLWVALEFLRGHLGFLSFPWAMLGHSQHENLALLQVAGVAGEAAISFLLVLGNLVIVQLRSGHFKSAAVAVVVIALAHLGGAWRLALPETGRSINVAAVQPNITHAERATAEGRRASYARIAEITRSITPVALIAWPETAIPDPSKDPAVLDRAQGLADELGTPLLTGAAEIVKFRLPGPELAMGHRLHNAAYLLRPNTAREDPYRKNVLVPFGEYLPLGAYVTWPEWFASPVAEVARGERRSAFVLADGTRIATLICWENLFADYVREVAAEADIFAHLSNLVWFGRTAASRQHNLASVLRAVENGIPVVIASNTGPSQIIDSRGRVVAEAPGEFLTGYARAAVPLRSGRTFYQRAGWLFTYLTLGVVVLAALLNLRASFARSGRDTG